jgi:hypothetical protein
MGASPPSPGQKDPLLSNQEVAQREQVVSAETVANENQLHHGNQKANEKIPLAFDFQLRKRK